MWYNMCMIWIIYIADTVSFSVFLQNRGLDSHFWAPLFEELLDVTSQHQIQYLTREDFNPLLAKTRKKWETNALNKLLVDQGVVKYEHLPSPMSPMSPGSYSSTSSYQTNASLSPEKLKTTVDRLLRELGLWDYFPAKFTLQTVMAITDIHSDNVLRESDIPLEYLKRLIMLEGDVLESMQQPFAASATDSIMSTADDLSLAFQSATKQDEFVQSQDLGLLVFLCCDHLLKQTLLQKLFLCRLAIPFIYPTMSLGKREYGLWSLRSIVVEWKNNKDESVESCIANAPLHVVSFCRLGDRLTLSKSKLMNDILSVESHPTFYHRDCPGATSDRLVSNGLIESSWFLPANKENCLFKEVTMFLNLRGNAVYHKSELDIISDISSILVVLVDTTAVNISEIADLIKNASGRTKVLVLFCTSTDSIDAYALQTGIATYQNLIGQRPGVIFTMSFNPSNRGRKSANTLTKDVTVGIVSCLENTTTLEALSETIRERRIIIDDDYSECTSGKELAESVMHHLQHEKLHEIKNKMLPLQGRWVEWSDLQKQAKRAFGKAKEKSALEQREEIEKVMEDIRMQQLDMCKSPTPLIKCFITSLTGCYTNGDLTRRMPYFLQWLKSSLDEQSRRYLPGLLKAYQSRWREFKSLKGLDSVDMYGHEVQEKQMAMHQSEKELSDASLGLEHIFREIGQMYVASRQSPNGLDRVLQEQISALPCLVANLLLDGYPFELMDGDASNIPLTWIDEIFRSLEMKVGKRKFFVVSVLGIQSSGKSTLLNTMFGLQFAVSAGRCTRGVYMQMVQVDKINCSLPFDYVLVIDSEGLRAPELGHEKFDRDNEIATFVIGLGDITVMNIKGENYGEMKDVLQIAVHAFLRMKLVSSYHHSGHRCLFIHQNVPAVNAEEKLRHSSQKLQEILDEMTKEAADQEKIVDTKLFNEIIDFDCYTHVKYFPDFWHGDPPMAHTNRGYTEKVRAVKNQILFEFSKHQQTFLSITDISQRIKDLWNGILTDDFVFSFRNCLEVKTYNALEKKVKELTWKLEENICQWVASTADPELRSCDDGEAARIRCSTLCYDLNERIDKETEQSEEILMTFCSDNLYRDIVAKWEVESIASFKSSANELRDRVKSQLQNVVHEKRLEQKHSKRFQTQEDELLTEAYQVAVTMRGSSSDLATLQKRFQQLWDKWSVDFDSAPAPNVKNIENVYKTIEHVLMTWHSSLRATIRRELEAHPLGLDKTAPENLVGTWTVVDIPKKSLSIVKRWKFYIKGKATSLQCRERALSLCNEIFANVERYIATLPIGDTRFQLIHITKLMDFVTDKTEIAHEVELRTFGFTPMLRAKIIVYIANFVYPKYAELERNFESKHTFAAKLAQYKEKAWNLFRNAISERSIELVGTDILCDTLKERIILQVQKSLRSEIVSIACRRFVTKHQLIFQVLEWLADHGILQDYRHYIRKPKYFTTEWMKTHIEDTYFKKNMQGVSRCTQLAATEITQIIQNIAHAIQSTKKDIHPGITTVAKSIEIFTNHVKQYIPVSAKALESVYKTKVKNLSTFWDGVEKRLGNVELKVNETFIQGAVTLIECGEIPLYQEVVDRLWGCDANCPFCGEPCERSEIRHQRVHSCVQHRPRGFSGWYFDETKEMIRENCNFAVQSHDDFDCHVTTCVRHETCTLENESEIVYHDFRDYKKHLPDWDIPPSDVKESSPYWSWVFCKFGVQLAQELALSPPSIPPSWRHISSDLAKDSLKSLYCLD